MLSLPKRRKIPSKPANVTIESCPPARNLSQRQIPEQLEQPGSQQILPSNFGYSQFVDQMDLSSTNVTSNTPEFQAVILAGYGNSLTPLTNDHKETASPKALLPIGNKPMITFPLTWLEDAGVTNVLLICPYSHRAAIAHHIHSGISSSFSTLRIDIQTYEDDNPPVGTCAVLRRFSSRIQSDFVILPCDFIPPPNLLLSTVLNRYRANIDQLLISTLFFQVPNDDEEKNCEDPQILPLVAYDEHSKTLLHVDYNTDMEADELTLHMRLLWKYPKVRIATRFADSHIYVCRRSILTVLALKPTLESFREDFLPFLCKTQYRKGKRFRWESVLNESTNVPNYPHSHSISSRATSRASSAPVSPITKVSNTSKSDIRCGIEIYTLKDGLAGRANTLKSYTRLNHALLHSGSSRTTPNGNLQNIDAKAQISSDCIIGPSARISERTSVKQSIIGQHCVIGRHVRISNSIVLDHVVIEDGAKIDGCILGRSAHIGAKAELSKCVTQPGYEVDAGAAIKNEKLETVEWDPRVEED
ncbi:hypothetical protein Clacol_000573 [Clathrus columnatus]|uniref:Translation initiation factor eIF2B subunit gamma n=1 Tax=Clathrus columnatus TaxID=1419009 RepID=A0AAV4ZYR0_9AGAM|nr:hypothetical protein Clacol_000573 [Clathrus columnatus]